MSSSGVTVVLGGQWGDEGKGKLVDLLSVDADYVCRCQGGNNAGHTVITNSSSQPYFFHLLPSGIINPNCISVIGNGVVVHLKGLFDEIEENEKKGLKGWQDRLRISARAHIVFDFHQQIDEFLEQEKGKESLGTTKKGIGPTYAAKCSRSGVRVCDLYADPAVLRRKLDTLITGYSKRYSGLRVDLDEEMKKCQHYAERIKPMVCDTVTLVNRAVKAEKNVIVEGANATMLDIDFGTYPFVTSSNCSAGVVCTGLGIPPRHVGKVYGVMKAYTTRVGVGAFPTQLDDEVGETLQRVGREFGVTTGRKRRCGWFDMVVARYSCMINGFTSIAIAKLDIMDTLEEVKIGVAYKLDGKLLESMPPEQTQLERVEVEYVTLPGWKTSTSCLKSFSDLHPNAQAYINKLAELLEVPIQWVGTGPSREDMIQLF